MGQQRLLIDGRLPGMDDAKDNLHLYLNGARDALLWKLEGISEYDARRPLTPTGTNLLGLVKHAAGTESGYFGDVFGRPFPESLPWMGPEAEPNADMWATAEESKAEIIALYGRVRAHSDATITALPLEAEGHVPWWGPDGNPVSLHRILVHVTAETQRHAGHADIVRELIDGTAGMLPNATNLPGEDSAWWLAHHARLEEEASRFKI
jgi:uncharacterized protein DUF664